MPPRHVIILGGGRNNKLSGIAVKHLSSDDRYFVSVRPKHGKQTAALLIVRQSGG